MRAPLLVSTAAAVFLAGCGGGSHGGSGVGSGTFTAASTPSVDLGAQAGEFVLVDYDKDGRADAVALQGGLFDLVVLCPGGPDGLVAGPTMVLDGDEPRAVVTGDFDDDTLPDVVVWSEDGTLDFFETGITAQGFDLLDAGALADLAGAGTAVPGCLNYGRLTADADEDLLTGANGQLYRFDGNTGSFFFGSVDLAPSDFFAESLLADLDGDGDDDLAALPFFGAEVRTRENNGGGGFFAYVGHPMPSGMSAVALVAGDFDASGLAKDLVAGLASGGAGSGVRVAVLTNANNGNPAFAAPDIVTVTLAQDASVVDVAAADLDEDGDDDLVVATATAVYVLKNDGNAVFTLSDTLVPGGSVSYVRVGDVNGDGILDVVVRSNAALFTYFGDEA